MKGNGEGSISIDKRDGAYSYFWRDANGKHLCKRLGKFRSKVAAWRAAKTYRHQLENAVPSKPLTAVTTISTVNHYQLESAAPSVKTISALTARYRVEKMPQRHSTRTGYESWLKNRIIPQWGNTPVSDIKAYPVEQWLKTLPLSPKSKVEIRSIIRRLLEFAMLIEVIPAVRNPMELVTVENASKPTLPRKRNLTETEFQTFVSNLAEPFRTIAVLGVTQGLRISETLALRWSDVNWLEGKLLVQRGIVKNRVNSTKTKESEREMGIDVSVLEVLKQWKQRTQFSESEDWMFASPSALGRFPWSYDQVWRAFLNAGKASGIGKVTTHCLRHSYRSWLDAAGTQIATQQKLMRHRSIKTTMDTYGGIVTDEMTIAAGKVSRMALPDWHGNGMEQA